MPRAAGPAAALLIALLTVLAALASLLVAPTGVGAQEAVGTAADPVVRSVELEDARIASPGWPGPADRAVIGRSDVFADTLAATALAGPDGALLLTDGGPDADLRPEVAAQLEESMAPGTCAGGRGPTVYLAGGELAVSAAVEAEVAATGRCVVRLAGEDRVATAIAVADAIPDPSATVVLVRQDDWADAGAVGAWAAATRSRVLVTASSELLPEVAEALERMAPDEVVLVGGEVALSAQVEAAAAAIAPVRRVAGDVRDETAVAIDLELWGDSAGDERALADGYGAQAWTTLFAASPLLALRGTPVLYTAGVDPTPATEARLESVGPAAVLRLGPQDAGPTDPPTDPPAAPDLDAADVALQQIATAEAPLMLKARPGTDELWIAERAGRVIALLPDGSRRTALDITDRVSTGGERGLLGLAFDPAGSRLFASYTDPAGDSRISSFAVAGDVADPGSRQDLIVVEQPASNHNGGDLQWGPDGVLWWSLGDGGGADDQFRTAQSPDALLGSILRVDPDRGVWERWALGLRNPFRIDFDDATGDLYVADVGQGAVEEIDWLPAGTPAGVNLGWSFYEGTRRFADPYGRTPPDDLVFPVWEELHRDGSCSITGGVVYRGSAIPELHGAYLYSDLCRSSIRAILVQDGRVVQSADLGVSVPQPVGFGVDHAGEPVVLSLGGGVHRIVPG